MSKFYILSLCAVLMTAGACVKSPEQGKYPETTPDKVVLKFYSLLAQGGKLTLKEAHQMLTDKFGPVDPDAFRKWVQEFEKDTKIKIIETQLPKGKNSAGYFLAVVKMEVATPSMFGDPFISTSKMHLILDEKSNEWKIDFLAQSIVEEEDFRKAPAEAKAG